MRPWQAEFNKPYNRGLIIDCEGGEIIIARTDTAAEQEEWSEALGTVTDLLGNAGIGGREFGGIPDDEGVEDGEDDDYDNSGTRIQTTYIAQKEALLSSAEATGACTVVFQVIILQDEGMRRSERDT